MRPRSVSGVAARLAAAAEVPILIFPCRGRIGRRFRLEPFMVENVLGQLTESRGTNEDKF